MNTSLILKSLTKIQENISKLDETLFSEELNSLKLFEKNFNKKLNKFNKDFEKGKRTTPNINHHISLIKKHLSTLSKSLKLKTEFYKCPYQNVFFANVTIQKSKKNINLILAENEHQQLFVFYTKVPKTYTYYDLKSDFQVSKINLDKLTLELKENELLPITKKEKLQILLNNKFKNCTLKDDVFSVNLSLSEEDVAFSYRGMKNTSKKDLKEFGNRIINLCKKYKVKVNGSMGFESCDRRDEGPEFTYYSLNIGSKTTIQEHSSYTYPKSWNGEMYLTLTFNKTLTEEQIKNIDIYEFSSILRSFVRKYC